DRQDDRDQERQFGNASARSHAHFSPEGARFPSSVKRPPVEPIPLGERSPRLAAVRALLQPKGRRAAGRFTVEGPTLLREALAAGREPESVFATQAALPGLPPGLPVAPYLTSPRALARISDLESPPGLVAVFPMVIERPETLLDGGPILLLAGVGDPGNAGTLVRSAEIFGVERIVFGRGGVDPFAPKVVRATMGALFRVRLALAAAGELVAAAAAAGYTLVAASGAGEPLAGFRFPDRSLLAIGGERRGTGWLPAADRAVAIPQKGHGESLNAAVAGAILLYVWSQQSPG
ncbi:MAG: TrmH family RNA methyltransferase, partial [Vulcanimicrobiaceae bacterium]